MFNLLSRLIIKKHELIVEKEDVINTLEVINKHHKNTPPTMVVANCGWADDTNKWFIYFTTSEYHWELIRDELKVIRKFKCIEIPKGTIGKVYTTD